MHVLIIPSEHFLTSLSPFAGIFQLQQANALHDKGFQVGVIAPGVITPRFLFRRYGYSEYEALNGYPVYRRYVRKLYPQRMVPVGKSISFYKKLGLELYRLYKKEIGKPDIIHAHNFKFASFIAQAIHHEDNIPYIITGHSYPARSNILSQDWVSAIKRNFQQASAITAVSKALAREIEKEFGVHGVDILPNIVDSALLTSPLEKYNDSKRNFIFLNIASLDANKNQANLIEAFALHFKDKRVSLRIGGNGSLLGVLRKLVCRLEVENQVTFIGDLDRDIIKREMHDADCFVLSSLQETFGVVLIEALACGTPVISTRSGGPEDIVHEKNGLLVPLGDINSLGEAMVQMTQTKGQYDAGALREECRSRFGDEAFVNNAKKFYMKALEL